MQGNPEFPRLWYLSEKMLFRHLDWVAVTLERREERHTAGAV